MKIKEFLKLHFPFLLRLRLFYYELLLKYFPVYATKVHYRKVMGKELDLINPKDLNEKIQWLKLYSDTSKWPDLADKYKVRDYVKRCGFESILNELYGVWEFPEDINFDELPEQFVLKTNNGSGDVIVVEDKSIVDETLIREQLRGYLNRRFGVMSVEPHYLKIKPCVIAEKKLVNDYASKCYSKSIIDYKCWCFNGKVHYILVCSNRDSCSLELSLYDRKWNYRPECLLETLHYRRGRNIPKPSNFLDMINIAEILSKPFSCVRVDFYNIGERIYFGEMTFTSAQGCMLYFTEEFLLEMGKLIDLKDLSCRVYF